jgi:replicative DNA helicase
VNKFKPILDPDGPRQPELRWLTDCVVKYHDKYKNAPSFTILRSKLQSDKRVQDEDMESIAEYIDKMEEVFPKRRNRAYYAEVLERFIQTTFISNLVREVSALVNNGDSEDAEERLRVSKVPKASNISLLFLPDDIDRIFEEETDEERLRCVPTGIGQLDLILRGGLRPGELAVFIAPTGYGKSMALVDVASYAWSQGRNIQHFSFENTEDETIRRYVSNMTATTIEDLIIEGGKTSKTVLSLKNEMAEATGSKIAVSRLIGTRTNTEVLLADYYATIDIYGFEPDLIIVDYGDLMVPVTRGRSKYEDMQSVFAELRDFATEINLPLWTATQSNREGLKAKRVRLDHIADSLGKAMTADLIVGISRPDKDEAASFGEDIVTGDVAEMKVLKFRRGPEGDVIKVRTDFRLSRFVETDNEEIATVTDDAKDDKAKRKWRGKRSG